MSSQSPESPATVAVPGSRGAGALAEEQAARAMVARKRRDQGLGFPSTRAILLRPVWGV
jgi:hypothetical protein